MGKIIYFICNLCSAVLYWSIEFLIMLLVPFKTVCILIELIFNSNNPIYPKAFWADDYTAWVLGKIGIYTHCTDKGHADEDDAIVEIGWKFRKE